MNAFRLACATLPSLVPAMANAVDTGWQRYVFPETGASVDMPVTVFSKDGGSPQGSSGKHLYTDDGRADLTVQTIPNPANDTPAMFLAKMRPPAGVVYRHVTPDFFVVSSIRNNRIWYNRCNRSRPTASGSYMNCVLINYPAAEKRQWDGVVTRISHSLAG